MPTLLHPRATGFDISSESLKLVELSLHRGKLKLGLFDEVFFPRGYIERGEIKEREQLTKFLSEVRKKHDIKYIVASLPEERSYIFNIKIPYVEPKDIRTSVELSLEEHVPMPPNTTTVDYSVIGYNAETDMLEANISVLPKELVDSYFSLFEDAGFSPLVFEVEAQALANTIIPQGDTGTFMIVDFGHSRTGFSIIMKGRVVFNATLDFGGREITEAITRDLKISYEDAEKIKLERGIRRDGADDLFIASMPSLTVLKDEINKYFAYWNEKSVKEGKKDMIEKIYFTGGSATLKGFAEFMAGYLTIPFVLGNPWVNIFSVENEIPKISKDDSIRYAVAIGLALGYTTYGKFTS